MTVQCFTYEDRRRGLRLEKVVFDALNLLVGISGVGKTSIIDGLRTVRSAGLSSGSSVVEGSWEMEIQTEDARRYLWKAETWVQKSIQPHDQESSETPHFKEEHIELDGKVLVSRSSGRFVFEDRELPKIKDTESAISLFADESSIAPLRSALQRILFSQGHRLISGYLLHPLDKSTVSRLEQDAKASWDDIRAKTHIPPLFKAYLAYTLHPEVFSRIKEQYTEIFPSVVDVCVDRLAKLDPNEARRAGILSVFEEDIITIGIKERGMDKWIVGPFISSGMTRTFQHLMELEFSPPGTVIVIDEYENSMGVNCLPFITDAFKDRAGELQFILTSHHPYVIGNIPMESWRVVNRTGGTISVRNAADIPALQTHSKQDAFTLLMNSEDYEEGIQ